MKYDEKLIQIKDYCFVCGIDRAKLDKVEDKNKGFKYHIKVNTIKICDLVSQKDHNMWDYVFYMAYLLDKNPEEYDGNESKLRKLIDNKDIKWIPIGKSMSLEKEEDDEYETEEVFLTDINKSLKKAK